MTVLVRYGSLCSFDVVSVGNSYGLNRKPDGQPSHMALLDSCHGRLCPHYIDTLINADSEPRGVHEIGDIHDDRLSILLQGFPGRPSPIPDIPAVKNR